MVMPVSRLTTEQENFDVSQFFDPDAPSGEPMLQQISDPETGDVFAPGLVVKYDGQVIRVNTTDGPVSGGE
jgi:hypothetical protein